MSMVQELLNDINKGPDLLKRVISGDETLRNRTVTQLANELQRVHNVVVSDQTVRNGLMVFKLANFYVSFL